MEAPFKFKEFSISQDRCAMKIGTDGVLLGAWTPVDKNVFSILDIGTGTGLISLMLAQRSYADLIDALEIDENAYEQAVENFENSPWGDRLYCYHAGFDEFVEEMQDEKYDLIVSNPPFYNSNLSDKKTSSREIARFQDALPFEELISGAAKLLSEEGKLSLIVPADEESKILELAKVCNLYPSKITRVKGTPTSEIKRSLILLSFQQKETIQDILILEESRHHYTKEYHKMVEPFYLKL